MPIQLRQAEYTAPSRRGAGNLSRAIGSGISNTAESYQEYLDNEAKRLAKQEQAKQDEEDKKYTRDMEGKKYGLMERGVKRLESESEQDMTDRAAARMKALDLQTRLEQAQEQMTAMPGDQQDLARNYRQRQSLLADNKVLATEEGQMLLGKDPALPLEGFEVAREKMRSAEMMNALTQKTLSGIAAKRQAATAAGKPKDAVYREMDDTQLQEAIDILSGYAGQYTQPSVKAGVAVPGSRAPVTGPAAEELIAAQMELARRTKK